jgi:dipeptide/tripeptide permease
MYILIPLVGAGLFKSNIAPLVIDQYPVHKQYIEVLPSGERVIIDPESTIQRIYATSLAWKID